MVVPTTREEYARGRDVVTRVGMLWAVLGFGQTGEMADGELPVSNTTGLPLSALFTVVVFKSQHVCFLLSLQTLRKGPKGPTGPRGEALSRAHTTLRGGSPASA